MHTSEKPTHTEATSSTPPIPNLAELLPRQTVGMLATVEDHAIVSRPVTTLEIDGADTLWFMIAADSSIAADVAANARVCISYVSKDAGGYLSLRGTGAIIRDEARIQRLWNPVYSTWFDGPQDPNIALLCVTVRELEHWETPSTTTGRLVAFAKALATGDSTALGSHVRGAPAAAPSK